MPGGAQKFRDHLLTHIKAHLRSGAGHLSEESRALAGLGSRRVLGLGLLSGRVGSGGRVTGGRRSRGSGPGGGSRRAARGGRSSALTRHFG